MNSNGPATPGKTANGDRVLHTPPDYPRLTSGKTVLCLILFLVLLCAACVIPRFGADAVLLIIPLFAVCVPLGAFLFSWTAHGYIRLIAVLCGIAGGMLFGGYAGAFIAFAAVGCALVLSLCAYRRILKYEAVAWLSLVCVAVMLSLGAVFLFRLYGTVSGQSIRTALRELTDLLTDTYMPYAHWLSEQVPSLTELPYETVRAAMLTTVRLLPAILAAAVAVICYISVSLFALIAKKSGRELELLGFFWLPQLFAYVFIIVSLLSFLLVSDSSAGLVCEYLYIILTPGLALYGVRSVWMLMTHRVFASSKAAAALILAFILLLFIYYILPLLAFVGALICARPAVRARK